jgi:hypothetical protein
MDAEVGFLDDEFEAKVRDTALISTHAEALAMIEEIDMNAADIQAQIDAFRIEMVARVGEMPQHRLDWCRRASCALAMRRVERERILKRDRELRGVYEKAAANAALGVTKAERKLAGIANFTAQSEAAKAKSVARAADLELERQRLINKLDVNRHFVAIAKKKLSAEQFEAIHQAAREAVTAP